MRLFRNLFIILLTTSLTLSAQAYSNKVPWATGKSKGKNLQIFLVKFSPGDEITDYFGHIAMVVKDTVYDVARVYNFGLFSFDEGFISRFAMGRLVFWKAALSLSGTIKQYISANRTITFYELNLPDNKKLNLAGKLNWEVLPENSQYLYDHYHDNCATRLRDLIDQAVDGQFKKFTNKPALLTLREHTIRYSERNPLLEWLLMFLMNDSIDKPIKQWDEMFLPAELPRHALPFSYQDSLGNRQALIKSSFVYYNSGRKPVPEVADNWPLWTKYTGFLIGLLAIGLAIWSGKSKKVSEKLFFIYSSLVTLIIGFIGTALFFMSLFTDHVVTYGNENRLLASPLTFIVFFMSLYAVFKPSINLIKKIKWLWFIIAGLSLLLLVLKIFPSFDQDNLMIISILLPVNCCFAYAFYKKSLS